MAARAKGGYRCPRCKKVKRRSSFYPNPAKHTGIAHYCKPCFRTDQTQRHRKRTARLRAEREARRINRG